MFLENLRYKQVPEQNAPYPTETSGLGEAKHNRPCPAGDVGVGIISSLDSNQAKDTEGLA